MKAKLQSPVKWMCHPIDSDRTDQLINNVKLSASKNDLELHIELLQEHIRQYQYAHFDAYLDDDPKHNILLADLTIYSAYPYTIKKIWS